MNKKLIQYIREELTKELQAKTGWGRNEIMAAYDRAIGNAIMRLLDDFEDKNGKQLK